MTTHTESTSYDVVVVGAGPSGLATAVAASRAGARVLVVERHESTSTFPKATGVRPRTMEILRSWGLEQEVWVGGADLRLAAAVSATLADRQQQDFSLGIPQPETLAALSPSVSRDQPAGPPRADAPGPPAVARRCRAVPHRAGRARPARRRGVGPGPGRRGGAEERIEAGYVVGADGGGSTVRRDAGIEERQLGSEGEHLAVLFHGAVEERIRGHRYGLHIVTTPESGVFVPSGTPGRWVYDREWSSERDAQGATVEDHQAAIRVAAGMPDLDPEIVGRLPLDLRGRRRRADARRTGLPRRRRRPPDDPARGDRHEHRHRRRAQPRLEARLGGAWLGRRGAARQLRGRAAPDRAAQRPELARGLRRQQARRPGPRLRHGLPGAGRRRLGRPGDGPPGRRGRSARSARLGGARRAARLHARPVRRPAHVGHRAGGRWLAGRRRRARRTRPSRRGDAARAGTWSTRRATRLRAYDLADGAAVLVRPDGHIAWRADTSSSLPIPDLAAAVHAALGRVPASLIGRNPA